MLSAKYVSDIILLQVENYFMLLTALEENLAEYKVIREDLDKMFDVVCELNVMVWMTWVVLALIIYMDWPRGQSYEVRMSSKWNISIRRANYFKE